MKSSADSAEFLSSDIIDALDDANVRPDIHDIDTGPTVKLLPNEDVHENDIETSTPEGSDLISGKQTVVDEKKAKIRKASEGTEITRDKVATELEKDCKTETKSPEPEAEITSKPEDLDLKETATDSTDAKISEEDSKKVKVFGDTKRKKKSSSTNTEKIVETSKEDSKVSKEETDKVVKGESIGQNIQEPEPQPEDLKETVEFKQETFEKKTTTKSANRKVKQIKKPELKEAAPESKEEKDTKEAGESKPNDEELSHPEDVKKEKKAKAIKKKKKKTEAVTAVESNTDTIQFEEILEDKTEKEFPKAEADALLEPFKKGLTLIKSFVECDHSEQDVTALTKVANYENFTRPEVQMGFLRLAKRVSNPVIVEELVLDELSGQSVEEGSSLLGFKILTNIALKNPYSISNIDSFLSPVDVSPAVIRAEKAYIESIAEEVNSPVAKEEILERMQRKSSQMTRELPRLIQECQESSSVSEQLSLHLLQTFHQLDNVPAQAAMLGLASQVTSLPQVYHSLALDMVRHINILPSVGSVAVQHVREHLAIGKEDLDLLVKEQILNPERRKKNLIIWETVASFLQSPKSPTEFAVADNFQFREGICKALRSLVTLINQQTNVENQLLFSQLTNIPTPLRSLEAQVVMSTVSEELLKAPVTEKVLSQGLTKDNADSLPYFGFQALKTVAENLPLTVDVSDHLLESEDLSQEMISSKLALVLNTAHCIREKVSLRQ